MTRSSVSKAVRGQQIRRTKRAEVMHARSVCPIACSLDLLGDRWTLLIVRDLMLGKSQFKEFLASPEGIASNILTDRLARLTEAGLVTRAPLNDTSSRDQYLLTPMGASLRATLQHLAQWGLSNIQGTRIRLREREQR